MDLFADCTCKLTLLLHGDPAKVDRAKTEEELRRALSDLASLAERIAASRNVTADSDVEAIRVRHAAVEQGPGGKPVMDLGDGWAAHEDRADLLEKLDAITAERDAKAEAVNRLLDPEISFTMEKLGIQDTIGVVQMMVESFDELFRAQGAQNFITLDFQRRADPGPSYSVVIQRATGKTPAERYGEVARELQDLKALHCRACAEARERASGAAWTEEELATAPATRCPEHAAPIAPPLEPTNGPFPTDADHLLVDTIRGALRCTRCGKEQGFTQPIAANDLKALMASFTARHKLCVEKATT